MPPWGKHEAFVVHDTEPFNAEPPATLLADQDVTPNDVFYARNHGPIPDLDAACWRLTVRGLVASPLTLSLADLRHQFYEVEVPVTLQCAGNRRAGLVAVRDIPEQAAWRSGAISTALWSGVRLADVLAAAGPSRAAAHVAFAAPDVAPEADPPQPYAASIAIAKALSPEVLLAWSMNGQPLPQVHGGPLRLVVPGYVGARSVKWLQQVTVQREPSEGYFQAVAYRLRPATSTSSASNDGPPLEQVSLTCDILRPADGAVLPAGPTTVSGYAFGGERPIARVEVSADGGASWRTAPLETAASPWTWRHWAVAVDLPPGRTHLVARAIDSEGACQPPEAGALWNPKGYANTSWPRIEIRATK